MNYDNVHGDTTMPGNLLTGTIRDESSVLKKREKGNFAV